MWGVERSIKRDPAARNYMDTALTPDTSHDVDSLELFQVTESARQAADKLRRQHAAAASHAGVTQVREEMGASSS
ncbi:MAG TPA: hypothetical protein VEK35_05065, partial [Roseiarcus sp.]|nr:hypothetical protein [Roseiarcus sp.]